MADLSRLVEGLGLTNSPSERRYRQRLGYGNPVEIGKAPGAQSTTPQGWNGRSGIQNLQLKVLDPTSQVVPFPPFDLDSRLAGSLQSPGTIPDHLLKSLGFLPHRPSSKVIVDHDQPQAPTPDHVIQEDDESESWITTSLDSTQGHNEYSVAPVRARRRGFHDSQVRRTYGHSLLGSSIADISDDSSVPSLKTKNSLVPSQLFSGPGPAWISPLAQNPTTSGAKPHSSTVSQGRRRLAFEHPKQETATPDISKHSKLEQQHHTPPFDSTLPFQTTQDPKCNSITPRPLDYTKPRPPKTRPIATEVSSLNLPSPTYANLLKAVHESKQRQHQRENKRLTERNLRKVSQPITHDTLAGKRIENWLKDADADAEVDEDEEIGAVKESEAKGEDGKLFRVWSKDAEREGIDHPSVDRPQRFPARARALQDVTNLRQPGYLQKNSFFKDAKKH